MMTVLAHAGGWDEMLFLLFSGLLVLAFLVWSRHRADRREEPEDEMGSSGGGVEGGGADPPGGGRDV